MNPLQRPRSLRELIVTNPALAILLAINLVVFVAMTILGVSPFNPSVFDLFRFGGMSKVLLQMGQYWRLLTSMFIHAGLAHLAMNGLALYIALTYLRGTLPAWLIIGIYLLCGVVASLTSAYWYTYWYDYDVLSVGASGAIAGFFGVLLVWTLSRVYPPPMNNLIRNQVLTIIGLTAVVGVTGLMGGQAVDNAAHVGGLVTGVVVGVILRAMSYPRRG